MMVSLISILMVANDVSWRHLVPVPCCMLLRSTQVDDDALTFGVVSHPLRALESIVRGVYRPALGGQDTRLWGKAAPDTVHEFMKSLDAFIDNLHVRPGTLPMDPRVPISAYRIVICSP